MRVLALVPGGIDKQILFLPTLQRLHEVFPKAEIDVVVDPEAREAYQLSKWVKEVIPYGFQANNSPADWANLLGIVRDREFEAAITLTQSWSIALLLWLSGIPTRIGLAGGANSLFLTRTLPLKVEQSLSEQYHDLLQGLDITGPSPTVSFTLSQSDIEWADMARQQVGLGDQGYVLAYPGLAGADSPAKTPDGYPAESWATVLKDFQTRQPDLPLALLQTSGNFATISALSQMVPGIKILFPETIGQTAALVAGANLLLSTDSYPLYLAIALKVFALGLFGANSPAQQIPPAEGEEVRCLGIASPTGKVADIPPTEVLKKIWNE